MLYSMRSHANKSKKGKQSCHLICRKHGNRERGRERYIRFQQGREQGVATSNPPQLLVNWPEACHTAFHELWSSFSRSSTLSGSVTILYFIVIELLMIATKNSDIMRLKPSVTIIIYPDPLKQNCFPSQIVTFTLSRDTSLLLHTYIHSMHDSVHLPYLCIGLLFCTRGKRR